MSGKNSRRKGHNWERKCAQLFREIGWSNARRHLEYQGNDLGKDLEETKPFIVQCKTGKKPNFKKAYSQACDASGKKDIPTVLIKYEKQDVKDSRKSMQFAVLDVKDFFKLIKELRRLKGWK
tara:strand:- start:4895 stop:5260 length:366 start_codon:yes stop_codon:yes gene_type:complete